MRKKELFKIILGMALLAGPALAEEAAPAASDKLNVTWGGFIDAYYGYDFNVPQGVDRTLVTGSPFSTTFDRSNEFNINIAMIEAKVSSDKVRGRLALQTGTSVQTNYAGESAGLGLIKGPLPAELIQEASVGYQVGKDVWVDAGIYPSHIGFEGFNSRDNWTYTRSLMGDFSPYYQAGVRLSAQFSPEFSGQLHLLNGWQNIYETNQNKAVGMELSYSTDPLTLTYNNFISTDFILKFPLTSSFQVGASADIGLQDKVAGGLSNWYAGAFFLHLQATSDFALTARLEGYQDKDQVIVTTGTPNGFTLGGASLNGDLALSKNLTWRNEARLLFAEDGIFQGSNGPTTTDFFLVSSYGLSF